MLIIRHFPDLQRDVFVDRICSGGIQREEFIEHLLQVVLHLAGMRWAKAFAKVVFDKLKGRAEVVALCAYCYDSLMGSFEALWSRHGAGESLGLVFH